MIEALKRLEVEIPAGRHVLGGFLHVPPNAHAVVAFAHGSGSGRFSVRNQFVARRLEDAGLATLLLDLLDESEADDRGKVFDIELAGSDRATAEAALKTACEKLLANTVIENYRVEIGA